MNDTDGYTALTCPLMVGRSGTRGVDWSQETKVAGSLYWLFAQVF